MNKFRMLLNQEAEVLLTDLDAGRIVPETAAKKLLDISRRAGNSGWNFSDGNDYPAAIQCIEHLFAHPEASLEVLVNLYHGLDDIWLSTSMVHGLSRNPMVPIFVDVGQPHFAAMVVQLTKYSLSNNIPLEEDIFQENIVQLTEMFDTFAVRNGDDFMEQIENAEPLEDMFYWAQRCDQVAKIFHRGEQAWPHPLQYLFDHVN